MAEHLLYLQRSHDAAPVVMPPESGYQKRRYFEVPPWPLVDGSPSVTDFEEKAIVDWLMAGTYRQILLSALGFPPDSCHATAVVQPFYAAAGEGDIDVIVCPSGAPQFAIALECKRVKVESVNEGEDNINKLGAVVKGVYQANELYNGPFAFFQTYLCIICEVAAHAQGPWNFPNRGVRPHTTPIQGDKKRTTFRQIVEFPGRERLHQDIGVIHLEVAQPTGLGINKQANVRACAYRRAVRREQVDRVTNRVKGIMS
jgi:hypothetical protein